MLGVALSMKVSALGGACCASTGSEIAAENKSVRAKAAHRRKRDCAGILLLVNRVGPEICFCGRQFDKRVL